MATVKIELRKKANQDGTYPLSIRLTKDRKKNYIHTGKSIDEKFWDRKTQRVKKSHPNSAQLNNYLLKKLSEANNKMLELETQKASVTTTAVKLSLCPSTKGTGFIAFADMYLDNFKKAGKYNRFYPDQSRINRFKEFLKGDIAFQDITVPLLNRFRAYLKGTHNSSERSVVNHLIIIRTIFNMAIKGNILDQKYYPFGKDKVQIKFPGSLKIGLTPKEVKVIEDLKLKLGSLQNHSRNIWLFSFYFAGMRVSDVLRLRWSDFQNERLHYSMGKNTKAGSLKIPEKAVKILKQYEDQKRSKDDLIFPELKILDNLNDSFEVQRKISYAVKKLDKYLDQIGKLAKLNSKLTMHISRHTFGNISGDKISVQMLQKLYRHSSITTTIGYQANFIHKSADDALDAVLKM